MNAGEKKLSSKKLFNLLKLNRNFTNLKRKKTLEISNTTNNINTNNYCRSRDNCIAIHKTRKFVIQNKR